MHVVLGGGTLLLVLGFQVTLRIGKVVALQVSLCTKRHQGQAQLVQRQGYQFYQVCKFLETVKS